MTARSRDVGAGLVAAAAALLAMAGLAATGLLLLDAGRIGDVGALTAAVVALAAGGSATLSAAAPGDVPITLSAGVEVLPLGVTVAGAAVLGAILLRGGRDGLVVRGMTATVAMASGLFVVAQFGSATATVQLPDDAVVGATAGAGACPDGGLPSGDGLPFGGGDGGVGALDVGFSVAGWPAAIAGAAGTLLVLGACHLVLRYRRTAPGRWPVVWLITVVVAGLVAAAASGGAAAAGAAVLVLPLAVVGALPIGLGVPLTVRAEGLLGCALDGAEPIAPTGPLMWVSGAALVGLGIIAAARARPGSKPTRAPEPRTGPRLRAVRLALRMSLLVGVGMAAMTVVARIAVDLGAFDGAVELLDARLAADPLHAAAVGAAAGAVAGLAGFALVHGARALTSLPWRAWKDQARR